MNNRDPYRNSEVFAFDLVRNRSSLRRFLNKLSYQMKRIKQISERRHLKAHELVKLDVANGQNLLRMMMRRDDFYIIGYAVSSDNGITFPKGLYELCAKGPGQLLQGARGLGVDVSYGSFAHMKKFNYDFIVSQHDSLIQTIPEGNEHEVKKCLQTFMVLFPEAARNHWICDSMVDVLGKKNHEVDIDTSFYVNQFHSWKEFTRFSRSVSEDEARNPEFLFTSEQEFYFINRDIRLLEEGEDTRFATAERILRAKCLEPTDFDKDDEVCFVRNR